MADIDSKEHRKFAPYQWAHSNNDSVTVTAGSLLRFAEKVQAITLGSKLILEIAEQESLNEELRDDGDPPAYLGNFHTHALTRMVQINMGLLCDEAERMNDWVHEVLTPEGRASHYKTAAFRLQSHGEKLPRLDD